MLTSANAAYIQLEWAQIESEIDRISDETLFNGRKLLGGGSAATLGSDPKVRDLVEGLRRSWLAQAEQLILEEYGLAADGVTLEIMTYSDPTDSSVAYVQGTTDPLTGRVEEQKLYVNLAKFANFNRPNGGTAPVYADRVIAHEMVHAVMGRTMDFAALPQWFQEGAAEYIHGADERVAGDLAANGNDIAALVDEVDSAWTGSIAQYSAGYLAVKYLHQQAAGGIKAVMERLSAGDTLDTAIATLTATGAGCANTLAFLSDFQGATGQAFVAGLNLADADTGGIRPGTAEDVMADLETETWDPLINFRELWPFNTLLQDPVGALQVGYLRGEELQTPQVVVNGYTLGILGLHLDTDFEAALGAIDAAILRVADLRSNLGAAQNRLEHACNVNAVGRENLTAVESRLRDADMAIEVATYSRQLIMSGTSSAILAQANNVYRSRIGSLLRSVTG